MGILTTGTNIASRLLSKNWAKALAIFGIGAASGAVGTVIVSDKVGDVGKGISQAYDKTLIVIAALAVLALVLMFRDKR